MDKKIYKKIHNYLIKKDKLYKEAYLEHIINNPPPPPIPRHSGRKKDA